MIPASPSRAITREAASSGDNYAVSKWTSGASGGS